MRVLMGRGPSELSLKGPQGTSVGSREEAVTNGPWGVAGEAMSEWRQSFEGKDAEPFRIPHILQD